jgi:peptide/nickel transport system permease protein
VTSFILRRLFLGVIVLIVVSMLVFTLMHLLPGDPLVVYLGSGERAYSVEELEYYREQYHLTDPLVVQYFLWIGGVLHGDLGQSIATQRQVSDIVAQRLPITLNLAVLALLISGVIGPTLGTIAATRRGKWQDTTVSVLANLGITLPNFWVGMVLIYIFAYRLHWLPTYGYTSPFDDFWLHLKMLIMPVMVLSLFGTASQTRQARSSMLEVSHQDYIRTAWSKGLSERVVVTRHMLKNGLIPVVTTMGMQVSFLFGGAVLVEKVFNIPGLGRMMADGVANLDYQVVQGGVLLMALIVVATNIIVCLVGSAHPPQLQIGARGPWIDGEKAGEQQVSACSRWRKPRHYSPSGSGSSGSLGDGSWRWRAWRLWC